MEGKLEGLAFLYEQLKNKGFDTLVKEEKEREEINKSKVGIKPLELMESLNKQKEKIKEDVKKEISKNTEPDDDWGF